MGLSFIPGKPYFFCAFPDAAEEDSCAKGRRFMIYADSVEIAAPSLYLIPIQCSEASEEKKGDNTSSSRCLLRNYWPMTRILITKCGARSRLVGMFVLSLSFTIQFVRSTFSDSGAFPNLHSLAIDLLFYFLFYIFGKRE